MIVFEMKIKICVLLPIYYFGVWGSWTLGKGKFDSKTIRFMHDVFLIKATEFRLGCEHTKLSH